MRPNADPARIAGTLPGITTTTSSGPRADSSTEASGFVGFALGVAGGVGVGEGAGGVGVGGGGAGRMAASAAATRGIPS